MKRNFLFNYGAFIDEMKSDDTDSRYQKTVSKYEELFGCQDGLTLDDQAFYKEYLSQFHDQEKPFRVAVPQELGEDFDWELLYCLIFGSLSSDYSLNLDKEWKKNPEGLPLVHITIEVKSNDQRAIKTLDELWSFQILRLYEIYVNEQMNLAILREDGEEKKGIDSEKEQKLQAYNKKVSTLLKDVKSSLSQQMSQQRLLAIL